MSKSGSFSNPMRLLEDAMANELVLDNKLFKKEKSLKS